MSPAATSERDTGLCNMERRQTQGNSCTQNSFHYDVLMQMIGGEGMVKRNQTHHHACPLFDMQLVRLEIADTWHKTL